MRPPEGKGEGRSGVYRSLIVVDDFYADPRKIRAAALACDYPDVIGRRTFPGRNSRQKLVPPGFDQVASHLVGEAVVGSPDPATSHGKFRITCAGDRSRYLVHVDPSNLSWVGVIYLNPDEQCRGGTAFFRHKGLGSDRTPLREAELRAYGHPSVGSLLEAEGNDPKRWEHLMTVPMRFNRLILYRPWMWHSAGEAFGETLEDGRLVQLVFFQTPAGPAAQPAPPPR